MAEQSQKAPAGRHEHNTAASLQYEQRLLTVDMRVLSNKPLAASQCLLEREDVSLIRNMPQHATHRVQEEVISTTRRRCHTPASTPASGRRAANQGSASQVPGWQMLIGICPSAVSWGSSLNGELAYYICVSKVWLATRLFAQADVCAG